MILAIDCGCAECYSPDGTPLITAKVFDSVEDAKAHFSGQGWLFDREWQPHPQGGEHIVAGQGSVWIVDPQEIKKLEVENDDGSSES